MTHKEYLTKIEDQLNQSLGEELKKYIPEILQRVEKASLAKFIKEGDPILELSHFRRLFEDTISDELNKKLHLEKKMIIKEDIFETIVIVDKDGEVISFRYCLN